jgi:hypothetical protein
MCVRLLQECTDATWRYRVRCGAPHESVYPKYVRAAAVGVLG